MKVTKVDCDFLRICDECGDFVTVGYEIELTSKPNPVTLCEDCAIELSKYLLQETYLNDFE